VGFEVLTAMLLNTEVFADVTPCLMVLTYAPKNIRNVTIYQLTQRNIPEDLNVSFLVTSIVMTSGSKMYVSGLVRQRAVSGSVRPYFRRPWQLPLYL
jgi:hypothetical protein